MCVTEDPNSEICQMFHDGTDINETGRANALLVSDAPRLASQEELGLKLADMVLAIGKEDGPYDGFWSDGVNSRAFVIEATEIATKFKEAANG